MDPTFSAEKFNIFEIASVSPKVAIADPKKNVAAILSELSRPELKNSRFIVFPELCISGYTCGDLFFQSSLIEASLKALESLAFMLSDGDRLIAVGLPVEKGGRLFNCAAVIAGGEILGLVPKTYIPNYQEFYEKRWFSSGRGVSSAEIKIGDRQIPFGTDLVFVHKGVKVGVEICEDLWVPIPPSSGLCRDAGAELILNLSATDDNVGKFNYLKSLVASQSGRCRCAYAYSSAGSGESSTDLVFSGINFIACDGRVLSQSERFSRGDSFCTASVDMERLRQERMKYSSFYEGAECPETRYRTVRSGSLYDKAFYPRLSVDPHPFIPSEGKKRDEVCREIIEIQSWGLAQRLEAARCSHIVVGVSGGLDSTLALLVACNTFRNLKFNPKGIVAVTMPAIATSGRTHSNAQKLMECLGVTALEIPIKEAVDLHFRDIDHDPEELNAVYENSQARERTQILMDLANKYSGMVLGTGDMSEMALGWCTYNGDHMSMYNVNAGVPKTLVKYLVDWFADNSPDAKLKAVLKDIIDTPISPELIPSSGAEEIGQKTEELVGPYELHDFFLYHVLRNGFSPAKIYYLATVAFAGVYEGDTVKKWLVNFYKRFFSQQFKRSCMPDGPKIGSACLSPRGDWRMPSDAAASLWLKELEEMEQLFSE